MKTVVRRRLNNLQWYRGMAYDDYAQTIERMAVEESEFARALEKAGVRSFDEALQLVRARVDEATAGYRGGEKIPVMRNLFKEMQRELGVEIEL